MVFYADTILAHHDAEKIINSPDRGNKNLTLTFPVREGKIIASGLVFNDEDEFSYQGKMYDVISSKKEKDRITFICYSDSRESDLNQNLCAKIDSEQDDPTQKQKGASYIKFMLQDLSIGSKLVYTIYNRTTKVSLPRAVNRYQAFIFRTIVFPPPELS
jgi:hypothetical protein